MGNEPPPRFGRRTALKAFGVTALGAVGLGGAGLSSTSSEAANGAAPAVEWTRSYEGGPTEYTLTLLRDVLQREDGGYALLGSGQPITKTGPEEEQLSLIETDSEGEKQWISFAGEETDEMELRPVGFFATDDGGYVVVGTDPRLVHGTDKSLAGAAMRFDSSGDVEWFTAVDREGDTSQGVGYLYAVAQSSAGSSGEFAAVGAWDYDAEEDPWFVKFGADGSIQWERTYDTLEEINAYSLRYAFARDGGGYTLASTAPSFRVTHVDEDGDIQDSTGSDLQHGSERYIRDVLLASDGGFALVGEDRSQEDWDMWFVKLDENLDEQWSRTYDGPYEGSDGADRVLQTKDGGYALGGHMAEAYTGDWKPAIVKTDAQGNEQWEKLLDIDGFSGFVQTDDGGYAISHSQSLTKVGAGGTGDGDGGGDGEKTASVTYDDQDSDGTAVVVQSARLPEGGYLVVHASEDGSPGAVLGHSAYLEAGTHSGVEISLDDPITSDQTLIAMAHTDDGDEAYEFPDADGPYTEDGESVTDAAAVRLVC